MDKYIGRLLDGRYEILEEIGRGGMAVVYRARCHRLNRYVAVKILKEDLSRDEDFRRRFHAESQAVAMLSHPNIVAVYDVNRSNDVDYIVMELIDGLTLKQYMQQRGVLSWREALHFSEQIAKALEHAHSRGIVHRDIKPHNIMILKDGSVKVADFGIARLNSAQNTLTREALGSVHYISPEQAKGAQVDNRSDLYSLGVVMYEMLTGRLPYDGESPVAIAIQHINATPVPPRQINSAIPLGMQQITLHAMCSDLSARYSSATAMIEDMEAIRKNPQIVYRFNAGPGGATAYVDPRQLVQKNNQARSVQTAQNIQNAQNVRSVSAQSGTRAAATDPSQAARQKAKNMADRSLQQSAETRQRRSKTYYEEEYEEEPEKSGSKAPIIIILILLILAVGLGGYLWFMFFGGSSDNLVKVPSFIGQQISDVLDNDYYEDFNLIRGESEYSDDYAEGVICEQSVRKGQRVAPGTAITLTVSLGARTEPMPSLIGATSQEVENALSAIRDALDIKVEYKYEESDSVEQGLVISTDPAAGQNLKNGDTVTITISSGEGEKMVTVPNVIGLSEVAAVNLLEQNGLVASVSEAESDEDAGEVFYQSIQANKEVLEGTTVSIRVSLGRDEEPSPSPSPSEEPEESTSPSPTATPTATASVVPTAAPVQPSAVTTAPDQGNSPETDDGGTVDTTTEQPTE